MFLKSLVLLNLFVFLYSMTASTLVGSNLIMAYTFVEPMSF